MHAWMRIFNSVDEKEEEMGRKEHQLPTATSEPGLERSCVLARLC